MHPKPPMWEVPTDSLGMYDTEYKKQVLAIRMFQRIDFQGRRFYALTNVQREYHDFDCKRIALSLPCGVV